MPEISGFMLTSVGMNGTHGIYPCVRVFQTQEKAAQHAATMLAKHPKIAGVIVGTMYKSRFIGEPVEVINR